MTEIEKALETLAEKRIGLFICKANMGFSAVAIDRDVYAEKILLLDHQNAPTLEEAILKAAQSAQSAQG